MNVDGATIDNPVKMFKIWRLYKAMQKEEKDLIRHSKRPKFDDLKLQVFAYKGRGVRSACEKKGRDEWHENGRLEQELPNMGRNERTFMCCCMTPVKAIDFRLGKALDQSRRRVLGMTFYLFNDIDDNLNPYIDYEALEFDAPFFILPHNPDPSATESAINLPSQRLPALP
ncbi:hypothetical protein YB2330_000248 [Saitoella coloradoensis]